MKSIVALAILLSAVLLGAGHASADITVIFNNVLEDNTHRLLSTQPANRETLAESPPLVSLTFTRGVRADKSYIRVINPYGQQVNDGSVTISGESMSAALPPDLPPGRYRVKWRAYCACENETDMSDSFYFMVK